MIREDPTRRRTDWAKREILKRLKIHRGRPISIRLLRLEIAEAKEVLDKALQELISDELVLPVGDDPRYLQYAMATPEMLKAYEAALKEKETI